MRRTYIVGALMRFSFRSMLNSAGVSFTEDKAFLSSHFHVELSERGHAIIARAFGATR